MQLFGGGNKIVDFNETIQKIIQQNLPKMGTKLVYKKQGTQKTYSCLFLFGDTLYVGTRSSKLYIYRINDQQLKQQHFINPHCQVVSSVVANHKFFITIPQCDQESQLSIWETKNKMFLTAFKGHKSQISKAIFMKDQNHIATASWDGTTRIWQLNNLQNDQHIKLYKGTYPILQLSQLTRDILVFGGDDCYLIFWNWHKQQVISKVFGHAGSVTYIFPFVPYMLTCGGDNKFKIWEVSQDFDFDRRSNSSSVLAQNKRMRQRQKQKQRQRQRLKSQSENAMKSMKSQMKQARQSVKSKLPPINQAQIISLNLGSNNDNLDKNGIKLPISMKEVQISKDKNKSSNDLKQKQKQDKKNQIQKIQQQASQQQQQQQQQLKVLVKLFREDKKQYDSNVFCVSLNQTDIYIIDRQGQCFLINPKQTFKLVNQFEYNQNVTGVAKYGNLLYMTTTKGCIKVFQMKRDNNSNGSFMENRQEQNLGAQDV